MKYDMLIKLPEYAEVAPLVGVWIEILPSEFNCVFVSVAPLVGVWIEIFLYLDSGQVLESLPSWECGLK